MGIEVTGLFGLILLGLAIYAIVHVVQSPTTTGAKVLWVIFILVLPLIGFIVWLIAGPRAGRR